MTVPELRTAIKGLVDPDADGIHRMPGSKVLVSKAKKDALTTYHAALTKKKTTIVNPVPQLSTIDTPLDEIRSLPKPAKCGPMAKPAKPAKKIPVKLVHPEMSQQRRRFLEHKIARLKQLVKRKSRTFPKRSATYLRRQRAAEQELG